MDYRRYRVEGATYFFTVVTDARAPFLCSETARGLLRRFLTECQTRWPFTIDAIVLLPDHLHTLWTLPPVDAPRRRTSRTFASMVTAQWLPQGADGQVFAAHRLLADGSFASMLGANLPAASHTARQVSCQECVLRWAKRAGRAMGVADPLASIKV